MSTSCNIPALMQIRRFDASARLSCPVTNGEQGLGAGLRGLRQRLVAEGRFCFTLLLGSRPPGVVDPMAPKQRLPLLLIASWGVGLAASPGTNHYDLLALM